MIAFAAAFPVNRLLLLRGKGHALTHEFHGADAEAAHPRSRRRTPWRSAIAAALALGAAHRRLRLTRAFHADRDLEPGRSVVPAHRELLEAQDCSVWLLTEVSDRVLLPGYQLARTQSLMAARRHWAAVLTASPAIRLRDPHPASAAVVLDGVTFCSSILPWRILPRSRPLPLQMP